MMERNGYDFVNEWSFICIEINRPVFNLYSILTTITSYVVRASLHAHKWHVAPN